MKKWKILLVGSKGQIGWELNRTLQYLGEVFVINREVNLEFSDETKIRSIIKDLKPNIIINTIAVTDVENAGNDLPNTMYINSLFPKLLAEISNQLNILLVHFSTDSVFDGSSEKKYKEFDQPNPLNLYSHSKLEGERMIQKNCNCFIIFRITWIYSIRRKNFVTSILQKAILNQDLLIVNDQLGSPTWARCIAEVTTLALKYFLTNSIFKNRQINISKIYHISSPDFTNWFDFTKYLISEYNKKIFDTRSIITPISIRDLPSKVKRPVSSILDSSLLNDELNLSLPSWKSQVNFFLDDLFASKSQSFKF